MLANIGLVGANGQAHFGLIGDDVVLRSRADIAHRHDCQLAGLHLARSNGLQRKNRAGGDHDGIDCGVRRRPMTAFAVDRDADRIGICVVNPRSDGNCAGGELVADM